MIYLERRINTHLITLFLISPIGHQPEYNLFRKFLFQLDLKGSDSWDCTIERTIHVVLGVYVSEDYLVTEQYHFSSLLGYNCFELLLLGLRSGSRFCFFWLCFLRVHLIVDLERTCGQDLKEWLSIITVIDDVLPARRKCLFFVVDLKI